MAHFAALVPMRHHSERIPGKNYRLLAGKPLYAHIIETLLRCAQISEIVVDTDSPKIVEGITKSYPEVQLIHRPDHLKDGMISMNEILMHDVGHVQADFYLQTHSTNPLLKPGTVERAIETFLSQFPAHDSLFSVTRIQTRFWDEEGKPVNHEPTSLIRTQDLPPYFEENSCIYIFERDSFLARQNRLGKKPLLFEIDPSEALDINEETDFQIAECMLQLRMGI